MLYPTIEQSSIIFDEFVKIRRDRLKHSNKPTYNYYTLITIAPAVIVLG